VSSSARSQAFEAELFFLAKTWVMFVPN
jgi:hypothetical protein